MSCSPFQAFLPSWTKENRGLYRFEKLLWCLRSDLRVLGRVSDSDPYHLDRLPGPREVLETAWRSARLLQAFHGSGVSFFFAGGMDILKLAIVLCPLGETWGKQVI